MDRKLSLAGLLIGLLVGMTGMGGGSLPTPPLFLVFGFEPTAAIGTHILHGAIFESFGAARHRGADAVILAATGIALAVGCVFAAHRYLRRAAVRRPLRAAAAGAGPTSSARP